MRIGEHNRIVGRTTVVGIAFRYSYDLFTETYVPCISNYRTDERNNSPPGL
jgi:hypothetical protein